MTLIDLLNFQPLGDHGVHSLLSIRMLHIFLTAFVIWLYRWEKKEDRG